MKIRKGFSRYQKINSFERQYYNSFHETFQTMKQYLGALLVRLYHQLINSAQTRKLYNMWYRFQPTSDNMVVLLPAGFLLELNATTPQYLKRSDQYQI